MKKILYITPIDTARGNAGNQQDIRNRVSLLSSLGHDIVLVKITKDIENTSDDVARQGNIETHTLPKWSQRIALINIAKKIKQKKSNAFITNNLIEIIKSKNPDIIWLEYNSAVNLLMNLKKEFPEKKYYIRMHNYESIHLLEKIHIIIRNAKNIIHLLRLPFSFFIQRILENKTFQVADKIFSISKLDINKYQRMYGAGKLIYLPFFNEYDNLHKTKKRDYINALYMGSDLKHSFNLYGLKKVIQIARKMDDKKINFYITGSNLKNSAKLPDNVTYKGYVENLETFLDEMDVALSPINIGYGMKIKTYESLKRGFPAIIDKRSHSVFGGTENKDYLVADKTEEWIEKIKILKDEKMRMDISSSAIEFMKKNFSREIMTDIITKEIEN